MQSLPSALHRFLGLLITTFGLIANGCHALELDHVDATVEVDLVFPTPNATYKPTYPFPIVLAFQGMKVGWPHHVVGSFDVIPVGEDPQEPMDTGRFPGDLPYEVKYDEDTDSYSSAYTMGESPGGRDTLFFTFGVSNVINSTATTFAIRYDFFFHNNCTIDENALGGVRDEVGPSYIKRGRVTFDVDKESGADPVVSLADDECVTALDTIRMNGSLKSYGPKGPPGDRRVCPVLDEEDLHPEPEPCLVELPGDIQSSVSSLMMETASCTTGSWPAETLVASCGHDLSAAADDDDESRASPRTSIPASALWGVAGVVNVWMLWATSS
ncbi:hypothetical protein VUR80DRAFT_6298 [Thermomyces stellatus]